VTRVDSGFKKVIQEEQQVCVWGNDAFSQICKPVFKFGLQYIVSLLLLTSGTVYSYGKCSKIHCEFIESCNWM